jgi:hypothetical protein
MYLVFSEFTSRPISLLASNRASAFFFFDIYVLCSNAVLNCEDNILSCFNTVGLLWENPLKSIGLIITFVCNG